MICNACCRRFSRDSSNALREHMDNCTGAQLEPGARTDVTESGTVAWKPSYRNTMRDCVIYGDFEAHISEVEGDVKL